METEIQAWASHGPKQQLERFSFDPGPLGAEEVEIAVDYCGLCHSDLSILNDDWGMSQYPVVLGHEAVGRIVAVGEYVKGLSVPAGTDTVPEGVIVPLVTLAVMVKFGLQLRHWHT